jgi:hypothetical protein
MTKLEALHFAIARVEEGDVKDAMDKEEEKEALKRLKALQDLEDDIMSFLKKKITAVELYKRLSK